MSDQQESAAIRAAVSALVDASLRLIQDDPHQWSERPCSTCRAVSSIVGKPFGCLVYAERRALALAARSTEGEVKP